MRSRLNSAIVRPRPRAGMNAPATLVSQGATRWKSSGASIQTVGGARNPTFFMGVCMLGKCRYALLRIIPLQQCQAKQWRDVSLRHMAGE